ncbi:MAG: ornithine carbamoyltransferase [Elusimicrobiota bacterium]|nr:ornithine carbamoyltransferase [Elusimicrobiota bacterium]
MTTKFCNFLKLKDFKINELLKILKKSFDLKYNIDMNIYKPFANKSLAMIFEKPSTRTRVSFDVGMYQLGGQAIYLNAEDIQIGRGETIEDTARILSEYVNIVMIRTFEQEKVEKLAKFATIPIINGLSDLYHPCQILSDIFSIMEERKDVFDFYNLVNIESKFNKIKFLYIGDSTSNIANSLLNASAIFGIDIYFISPKNYELNPSLLKEANSMAKQSGGKINQLDNIDDLKEKFDIIYTDIWISMGKEYEKEKRYKALKSYQVNKKLLDRCAKKDVKVMHCLPAHRGEEITDDILENPTSIVFKQAGNRLHVQKAIMLYTMNQI